MTISKESKQTLKDKIVSLNEKIQYWQGLQEPLINKKIILQQNIDHIQSQIDGLRAEKQKLQLDIDLNTVKDINA